MRVVHLSSTDTTGGAGNLTARLHCGLREAGVDSVLVYERGTGDLPHSLPIRTGFSSMGHRLLQKAGKRLAALQHDPSTFGCSLNLRSQPLESILVNLQPDILHLHWVGDGCLPVEQLPRLPGKKIWTLHDLWPLAGSEHVILGEPERLRHGYTRENRPAVARGPDWNRQVWERKWKHWRGLDVSLVSPSRWMREQAQSALLWRHLPDTHHHWIPHGIDLDFWSPGEPAAGALGWESDPNSFKLFVGAFARIPNFKLDGLKEILALLREDGFKASLLVAGNAPPDLFPEFKVIPAGPLSPARMRDAYRTADVTLIPSRMESFSLMTVESLACGTPVAGWDCSGLSDTIPGLPGGFRTRWRNPRDFANGVRSILATPEKERREAARDHAETFPLAQMINHYRALYEKMVD